ncbi:MAG: hypothetical protein C0616_06795 [Desulfuromonas sp.]|nr:MAG: hypothetical protein C0616_06795 [Desulfuromonas sp.]
MRYIPILLLIMLLFSACSLPPDKPVTRRELNLTGLYQRFEIKESPEMILNALNRNGEVILEGKRKIRGKDFPVYIKLLATSEGLEILDYDK